MLRLLRCEYLKLKRSSFLLIGLLGTLIVPFFVSIRSVARCLSGAGAVSLFGLYDDGLLFLMLLSAPMVLTILGAWIIGREYTDGTLKNIFVIPVSRAAFLAGKLLFFGIVVFLFMLLTWLEILALAFLCSFFLPVIELTLSSALYFLMKLLRGAALLCATETPFLYLAVRTKGFLAPMAAMTAVSLVNVVLSASPFAGYAPWTASYLLARGHFSGLGCPVWVSVVVILAVSLGGIGAGMARFVRDE